MTLNYQHDLGQLYESYAIGDSISFGDSNWYVIKNSSVDEDYVTVIKDRVLTREELGEYAESNSNTMKYKDIYDTSTSGNYASITYDKSNVKKFLEESYLSSLESSSNNEYSNETGATNLKEVDRYKVRLLNVNDLLNNLGYERNYYPQPAAYYYDSTNNTPTFVYQNFGNSYGYWTMNMSAIREGRQMILQVAYPYQYFSVRQVINVYKSSLR